MNPERTLEAYSAIAPVYGEYSRQRQAYLDAVDAKVISSLRPGIRWLDIGAGDGRRLAKIQSATGIQDIHAVEPSAGMAAVCRAQLQVPVHEVCAENIDQLDIGQFDAVTALWNVFGHVTSPEKRLTAMTHIAAKMKQDAIFMIDVNNRHNARAYGTLNVFKRIIVDALDFDVTRGDASYEWKIGDQTFQSSGHLFTPGEIEGLFSGAGLRVHERLSFDYATGQSSSSPYKGQLFYTLKKR